MENLNKLKIELNKAIECLEPLFDESSKLITEAPNGVSINYLVMLNDIQNAVFNLKDSKDKIEEWESRCSETE